MSSPSTTEALRRALEASDVPRPHEVWLRLGEAHLKQGHLRRALGAFRRAQEVDARGEYTRQLFEAVNALSHVLHQHQRFFLHVADETARHRAQEPAPSGLTTLGQLAEAARLLRPHVRDAAHTALECLEEQATQRALSPRWAELCVTQELEQHGGEEALPLARAWRAALLELYEELLEREEPDFEPSSPGASARTAIAARRWPDAWEALHRELATADEAQRSALLALARRWSARLALLDEPALSSAWTHVSG